MALLFAAARSEELALSTELTRDTDGALALRLRFQEEAGKRYELLAAENLSGWRSTGLALESAGGAEGFLIPLDEAQVFHRVVCSLAASYPSAITGISYPIHVYVPDSYHESSRAYPVIYATDGQWIAGSFSSMIAAKGKEVILVAIEQGPGDRRATDYRLPGARDYYRFLTTELIPTVESLYRVDGDNRTICGTSYGGLLVGLVLFMERPESQFFKNYLSFDGSFYEHRTATNALEEERFKASQTLEATLLLTSATRYPNNNTAVNQFQSKLEQRGYAGLTVIRRSYSVVHNDVADPSFEEALDVIFPEE